MDVMEKIFSYRMAFDTLPSTSVCDYPLGLSTELMSTSVNSYSYRMFFHVPGTVLSLRHTVIYVFLIPILGSSYC